jgi:hypothetical protein
VASGVGYRPAGVEAQAQARAPELRPLGVGEILDVAIKISWRTALTLFRIVVLVVAPVQLIASLVTTSASTGDSFTTTTDASGRQSVHLHHPYLFATSLAAVLVLSIVASTLATAACFKAVADAYLGQRPTWRTSLAFALRRLGSILLVILIAVVVLAVILVVMIFAFVLFVPLGILCVAPAIWIAVRWSVSIPALLTEGVRGTAALGRSWRLVRGRWWGSFAVIVIGTLLSLIVSSVVQYGLAGAALAGTGSSSAAEVIIGTIGGTIASMLTTPFTAAFIAVLYFDLRVRKEGFDLELLAERIGLTPRPAGDVRPAPPGVPA